MPFDQTTQPELADAISRGHYPKLRDLAPHVSQALSKVVATGMNLDPKSRLGSAREFDSSLGRLPHRVRRFTPITDDRPRLNEHRSHRSLSVGCDRAALGEFGEKVLIGDDRDDLRLQLAGHQRQRGQHETHRDVVMASPLRNTDPQQAALQLLVLAAAVPVKVVTSASATRPS
jgi:hypothetical protein